MTDTEKLCRLCLRHVKNTFFDDLGELCNILDALSLKVNLDVCEEPVICVDCIQNLGKLYSFKVICVQSEDFLIPFSNSHIDKKIDLPHVYLEIDGSKNLGDKKVCRFCMCETPINSSLELNAAIELMLPPMYLLEFFPEMDMNLVRDPIICKTCHNFLQHHLTFTRKCINVEESIQKYVEIRGTSAEGKIDLKSAKQFMDKVTIIEKEIEDKGTFKHEIQHDEIVEDASSKEDIKMESYIQIEDSKLEMKSESIEAKPIMNSSESPRSERGKKYTGCEYLFNSYGNMNWTMWTRMVSYCNIFVLDIASAESRKNYNKHFAMHKSIKRHSSAVIMHICGVEECLFKTKYKGDLIRHKLIHEDPLEITMYKCEIEGCSYESKHRHNLMKHKLIHKDVSEVMMYKCRFEGCLYETKRKNYLPKHKLIHKDILEVMMYRCGFEGCLYKTKHKRSLIRHMLIHKDPSQVTKFKCEVEGCSYKTKYKNDLIKHKSIHKDQSEITM